MTTYRCILIFLILAISSSCLPEHELITRPVASDGVLDLRGWNFQEHGNVNLNGKWEFYWNQLYTPQDFADGRTSKPTDWISVPGIWGHDKVKGEKLEQDGYATYRLIVQNRSDLPQLALKIRFIRTAYRLYINNQLFSSVGRVGENKEDSIPRFMQKLQTISDPSDELQIIVQLSSFHGTSGGIFQPMTLGTADQVFDDAQRSLALTMFLCGSLLIMALYHFILFFLRRQDRSTLYLGVFCIIISLYSFTFRDGLIMNWFPGLSFEAWMKLVNLPMDLGLITALLIVHSLFPNEMTKNICRSLCLLLSALLLIRLGVSYKIFSDHLRLVLTLIAFLSSGAVMYAAVLAVVRKREGALLFLSGFIILGATAVWDLVIAYTMSSLFRFVDIGLLIFIVFQSFILAQRFSRAFKTIEIQKDQVLTLDRLKDEFLANTSHELRTPLNGIVGIAESLIDGATGKHSPETCNNLNMIVTSGKRLTHLVDDILEFSKMKYQGVLLKIKPVDVKSLVDMVFMISRPLLSQKPVELINQIPDHLPLLNADEDRLQQILINLVSNGIKFTHHGEVVVSAELEENGRYRISVKDTGIGIARENQDRVFRYFEQADGSISREFGGSGLGLAVTQKLVELHGSAITVQSSEGIGSTFSFSLLVAEDQKPPQKQSSGKIRSLKPSISKKERPPAEISPQKPSVEEAKKKTILVVDDEAVNLQVLKNHLGLQNYRVLSAEDGFQAMEILKRELPDLVVLDLMMPRMSGYEVCQKIRESHSPTSLPVLMLTAKNQVEDLVRGFDLGANDYLAKPFYKDELLSRIRVQLQLQDFSRALEASNRSLEENVLARTRELSAANDQLKHMLHVLCHDLQNPLSGLSTMFEMINKKMTSYEEMEKLIGVSLESGLETIELIQKMRALEEKKFVLKLEGCNLKDLLSKSRDILSQKLTQKDIEVVMDLPEDQLVKVEKTSFVNTVINNIFSNAIKFSFPGSKIEIKAHQELDSVILKITDHGIGIPEKLLGEVFNMGKHTSRKGTHQETGTGFGMPLVKKFVTAYQGTIEIISKEKTDRVTDHGTTIILTLKAA